MYIFEQDGDYVNFNGGGNLWRIHKNSQCVAWHWDETGDLFFDVYDQQYVVKAENIATVTIGGVVLSTAADFETNIKLVFPGLATATTLVSTVTLTDAQIKALNSVAVTLIDAPGASKTIFPQSVYIRVSLPTGDAAKDYGNINAAAQIVMSVGFGAAPIYFLFDEAVNGSITNLLSPGAGVTALHAYSGISSPTSATTVVGQTGGIFDSDVDNVALSMYMNNSSGALNGGDASNSMKVTIYYVIVDL